MRLYGAAANNELSDFKIKEIDKALVKMIVKDFQPLSVVENEGFLQYTQLLKTSQ